MPLNYLELRNQTLGDPVSIDWDNIESWFRNLTSNQQIYVLHWIRCHPDVNDHPVYGRAVRAIQINNLSHRYYREYGRLAPDDLGHVFNGRTPPTPASETQIQPGWVPGEWREIPRGQTIDEVVITNAGGGGSTGIRMEFIDIESARRAGISATDIERLMTQQQWRVAPLPRSDGVPNIIHEDSPFAEWEKNNRHLMK